MKRSKSLEGLPEWRGGESRGGEGEGIELSEEMTRQAMLDIIQSEGTQTTLGGIGGHITKDTTRCHRVPKLWNCMHPLLTERTIYRVGHIATSRRAPVSNITYDIDTKREKEYITMSHLLPNQRAPFKKMIMQTFYQPNKSDSASYDVSKQAPRGGTNNKNAVSSWNRRPSCYIKINSRRDLCTPEPCRCHGGDSEEYCDILGPGACARCIESTNRRIANVIQTRMFPAIEVSNKCLVVPKLSRVMKDGHMKQARKYRLQELCLAESHPAPQRENQINWNSLHPRASSSLMSTCGSLPSVSLSLNSGTSVKSLFLD